MPNIFDEEPKQEDKYDLFKNDKPFVRKKISRLEKDKIIFDQILHIYPVEAKLCHCLLICLFLLGIMFGEEKPQLFNRK